MGVLMAELTHLITLELCVTRVQAKQLQKHILNTSINYAQLNTPQFIEENEQTDLPLLFLKGPGSNCSKSTSSFWGQYH